MFKLSLVVLCGLAAAVVAYDFDNVDFSKIKINYILNFLNKLYLNSQTISFLMIWKTFHLAKSNVMLSTITIATTTNMLESTTAYTVARETSWNLKYGNPSGK